MTDAPWRDAALDAPLPVKDGFFALSEKPGLLFDLVEEELERHPGVARRRAGFYV